MVDPLCWALLVTLAADDPLPRVVIQDVSRERAALTFPGSHGPVTDYIRVACTSLVWYTTKHPVTLVLDDY
jgi:hypothetical protein